MANVGTIESIEQIYSFVRTGTVQDGHSRMDTSVSTTTSHGGGYNARATTNTSVSSTEMLRIFVREDDGGKEFEAEFADPDFGVREGHRVTVVYAGDRASKAGYPMGLVNHSTGRSQVFAKRAEWIVKRTHQGLGCGLLVGVPAVAAILHGTSNTDTLGLFVLIAFLAVAGWLFARKRRNDALAQAVVEAVRGRVREAAEEGGARGG